MVNAKKLRVFRNSSFRGGIFSYLDIIGSGTDHSITIFAESGVDNGNIYFCPNGSATRQMTITSGGNVLIATTTDAGYKLDVNGTGRFSGNLAVIAGFSSITSESTTAGNNAEFKSISTVRTWQIGQNITESSTGSFEFYDTNAAALRLKISSTGAATFSNLAGTGSRAVLADANGLLSAPVSDISVKENIKTLDYGINDIMKLKPVSFEYIKSYKNYGQGKQIGNIAQDMQKVIPEAVFTTPSTGKMGINYDQLNGVYIKALQELQEQINTLKLEIQTLKNK